MMPRPNFRSRPLLAACLTLAAAALLITAAAAFHEWWDAMPTGRAATYVGREVCAECHRKETDLWVGSDHDLAMDHATPDTVLGDFNDAQFTHVAFDDLVKLNDEHLGELVRAVPPGPWSIALSGAGESLKRRVLALMADETRRSVVERMARLGPVRPCDATDAHQEIGDAARRLGRQGRIAVDFAVTSRMSRQGDRFYVTTDNRQGRAETFHVKYVFGVRPLQQYLVEFPDGRIQCLPLAWDTERKQWYHLYPKEPIPHEDQLHWTGPLQNWNYMCAECHTTNLKKNFSVAENAYRTTWSEIDVSCETCHGPGSIHVELAESRGLFGFWDRNYRYGLPDLKNENPRVEIENCAPCHSRRRIVYPNDRSSTTFCDFYLPEVPDGDLYYADGQVLEEDYVYGSFIQSKMYDQKVRCTNCHDPHSVRVKYNDNRLCCQCHVQARYDTPLHHFHPDASKPGTLCVECHMPETKYMVVDPRRDHSLRVPRPDLTVDLQIPNACNGCHDDPAKNETAQWAADQVRAWYGEKKNQEEHFAYGIAAARELKPEGEARLLKVARSSQARAAIRASAISLLSNYRSGNAEAEAVRGLEDGDPLLRAVAVRSLEHLDAEERQRRLTPMLRDPVRAVRSEAARLLSQVPRSRLAQADAAAFDAALKDYIAGQVAVADQAAAHLNLGVLYFNLAQAHYGSPGAPDPRHLDLAEQEYRAALRIDPKFIPARINLAMFYDTLGRKDDAEKLFREIIELEPELAEAHYSLGLLLAEDERRMDEAAAALGRAAALASDNPRIHYNYGLALQKLGRPAEAEEALKTALRISGTSQSSLEFLHALAILYAQQKLWDKAISCAERILDLLERNRQWPEAQNPQWPRLLEYLRAEKAAGS